ncbi:MAG: bifunctional DNA-formamidopyrimidine glycosylase/DNA-(apurinic or apyrimidinic site) lyase [Rickettsiales bacterium]|nr:bifunctional DNA-formamidopyrimidine glycosylase/DNA-(apurinic or apyrimidinic site) lyase [Rickettsiales bacterium]
MPELPEVETVRTGLEPSISNRLITRMTLNRPDLRFPFPKDLKQRTEKQRITHIARRAKYLLFHLSSGDVVLAHLGMSGKMLVGPKTAYTPQKHDHVLLEFEDGTHFVFNDARRFGMMSISSADELENHDYLKDLGPEPLSNTFHADYLKSCMEKSASPIKTLIMNQKTVVGVGNIYACEALFRSNINPFKPAKACLKGADELTKQIKNVLNEAIKSGGSTLRDYVRSSGELGYFQHQFLVYGRENEPCVSCNAAIRRKVQSNRSTFYCHKCQRVK